jgi:hypothetical protein
MQYIKGFIQLYTDIDVIKRFFYKIMTKTRGFNYLEFWVSEYSRGVLYTYYICCLYEFLKKAASHDNENLGYFSVVLEQSKWKTSVKTV